jgi:hypothetical protein
MLFGYAFLGMQVISACGRWLEDVSASSALLCFRILLVGSAISLTHCVQKTTILHDCTTFFCYLSTSSHAVHLVACFTTSSRRFSDVSLTFLCVMLLELRASVTENRGTSFRVMPSSARSTLHVLILVCSISVLLLTAFSTKKAILVSCF